MKYKEVKGNLFDAEDKFYLAHCIAADCAMGAGIATQFVKRNPRMRKELQKMNISVTDVLFYKDEKDKVFNLITKEKSYGKPTRESFNETIINLKNAMEMLDVRYLAIPKIGAGLDRLDWNVSREFIKTTFKDTDVTIRVYVL